MDPIGAAWVLDRINWLIGRFAEREDRNIERKQGAIDALLDALTETRIYFGTQRIERKRNRQKEEELSRLWSEASRKVKPIDEDLAHRCYVKGTYWADPIGWGEKDFLEAGIAIEQVEEALNRFK